jgi:hypothetical protein
MIVSPPRETYRQNYAARIALTTVALIAAMIVYFVGREGNSTVAMAIAAAIILADVLLWVAISKTVLTIHEEGIRRVSVFGVKEMEWRNVKEYRYRVVNANVAAAHAGGLIGLLIVAAVSRTAGGRRATTNFFLQLIGNDGSKIGVTSSFQNAYDAIGAILGAVHDQLRPEVASRIGGTGATFGPIRLSSREIQWKSKDPVLLGELAYAEIVGSYLQIKKSGKMLKLVSVRSDRVPNVLLFLEQIEKLGVGAKRANAVDPLAHVRM